MTWTPSTPSSPPGSSRPTPTSARSTGSSPPPTPESSSATYTQTLSRDGLLGVRPGILHAAVQAQRLLLHHRRDRAVARALLVAVAEGVPHLVVDHVEPVGG